MISQREMRAVRAYDRVFANSTEGWNEAEAADASYDGGEWSGPSWAKNWLNEDRRVISLVAERFEIYDHDLQSAIQQRVCDELWKTADGQARAMFARSPL